MLSYPRLYLFLILALIFKHPLSAQFVSHVILITIYGMRPEFYEDSFWPTPTLQYLKQEGYYAIKMRPVFPTVTLPNHATLVTGALPARHGVYFNTPFNPLSNAPAWNFYANIVKIPTFFERLHMVGKLTAAIDWPMTVGAIYIDCNYPDYFGFDDKTDNIALMRQGVYSLELWGELEVNVLGEIPSEEINSDHFLRTDENSARIAAYLIMRYKPTFTAFTLPKQIMPSTTMEPKAMRSALP